MVSVQKTPLLKNQKKIGFLAKIFNRFKKWRREKKLKRKHRREERKGCIKTTQHSLKFVPWHLNKK